MRKFNRWTLRALLIFIIAGTLLLVGCDKITGETEVEHEHVLVDHEGKAPTCYESGYAPYQTCSECDEYTTYQDLPMLFHEYYSEQYFSYGDVHARFCKHCGEADEQPHNWVSTGSFIIANCSEYGEETFVCSVCKAEKTVITEALGHSFEEKIIAPTCTSGGKTVYTCHCGYVYFDAEVAPLGHSFTEPTCTTASVCTTCGAAGDASLGHLNDVVLEAIEPTCISTGLTEGAKCSRCGTVTVEQAVIPANGHSFTSALTAPTCTEFGYTTYSCSGCSESYVADYTSALGHSYSAPTCDATAVCSTCGHSDGNPLGHDWLAATCRDPQTCQRAGCGLTVGEPLGHDFAAATCTRPMMCQRGNCGFAVGDPLGHNMSAPTCYEPSYCLNGCGCVEGEKLVHTVEMSYVDSTLRYVCNLCSTYFTIENQRFYLDGTNHVGMTGVVNLDRGYATHIGTNQPVITEDGYYTLLKTAVTESATQLQIWMPKEDKTPCGFSSTNNAVGFLSFSINSYTDKNLDIQLVDASATGGRWSADWCITKKIFSVSPPKADGDKIFVTVTGLDGIVLNKIEVTSDNLFTGWYDVAMGIVLDPITDSLIIYYYIDGVHVGTASTALTTSSNAINSVYLSGNSLAVGSGVMLDNIAFGYTTDSMWTFDQHNHEWFLDTTTAPTCEDEGYATYKCAVCGVYNNQDYIPAFGHDYSDVYEYNNDVHSRFCSRCDSTIDEDHNVHFIENILDPTCGNSGLFRYYCDVCDTTAIMTTPATGNHTGEYYWMSDVLPTATTPGREIQICLDCNGVIGEREVPAEVESMPIIYLTGDYTAATAAKNEVKMGVEYVDPNGLEFTAYATIKVQGSSSVAYPKKNYTIKFYKDADYSKKYKVDFGWGNESKYVMKANWVDFTNARNIVSCRLWKDMVSSRPDSAVKERLMSLGTNAGAIDGFAIAVYMNGSFYGLYTMNVPKDEWMFGMDDSETEALICADNWNSTDFSVLIDGFYENADGDIVSPDNGWELRYCGSDDYSWVAESFNNLILFCQQNDGEAFRAGISQYLDVDAAIDYVILMYANGMRDNASKNMLWATYDGSVWIPSVYDQDGTFGQSWDGVNALSPNAYLPLVNNGVVDVNIKYGSTGHNYILWSRILNCFTEEVLIRYQQLRMSALSTEHIIAELKAFEDSVPASVYEADRLVWAEGRESWWAGKKGNGVWYEKYNFDYMYTWVDSRMQCLDAAMTNIYNNAYLPKVDTPAL